MPTARIETPSRIVPDLGKVQELSAQSSVLVTADSSHQGFTVIKEELKNSSRTPVSSNAVALIK